MLLNNIKTKFYYFLNFMASFLFKAVTDEKGKKLFLEEEELLEKTHTQLKDWDKVFIKKRNQTFIYSKDYSFVLAFYPNTLKTCLIKNHFPKLFKLYLKIFTNKG